MQEQLEAAKLVVALRTARAITGWSQQEFATKLQISKSKVARMEMMEADISVGLLTKILRLYKEMGIEIDVMFSDELKIIVHPVALNQFKDQLLDETQRRSDRGITRKDLP